MNGLTQSNTDNLECINLSSCAALEIVSISSERLKQMDLTECNALKKAAISSHVLEKFKAPGTSLVSIYLNCPSLVVLNLIGEKLSDKNLLLNCPILESINGEHRDMAPQLLNKR